jgi:hypothetical protein
VANYKELVEELALAYLGEDFQKNHARKAAEYAAVTPSEKGEWHYYNNRHYHHKTAADFHDAAFKAITQHPKLVKKYKLGGDSENPQELHARKARRHRLLATAHEKLRAGADAPEKDSKTGSYIITRKKS